MKAKFYKMEFEIKLSDLQFYAYHGVLPEEEKLGNRFSVDLEIKFPVDNNNAEDDICNTVSYADLYDIVKEEMEFKSKLLETVALRIRKRICDKWNNISSGKISITKLTPPIPSCIGKATVSLNFF